MLSYFHCQFVLDISSGLLNGFSYLALELLSFHLFHEFVLDELLKLFFNDFNAWFRVSIF